MSQELEHVLYEEILAVLQKYKYNKYAPAIVAVLGKIAGAMIGQITSYSHSDETVTKEACRFFHSDVEEAALIAHKLITNKYKRDVKN